jgi:Protein of unknwon function (DUF3310)
MNDVHDKIKVAVDHPAHYNALGARCLDCKRPIECIDVIEHMPLNLGNSMKYIWRAGLKSGEDFDKEINKAIWYLNREMNRRKRES